MGAFEGAGWHPSPWSVGFTGQEFLGRTFVERWNGSLWQPVDGPRPTYELNAVAAGSADDIWMVGIGALNTTLTEHWDGTSHFVPC